MRQLLSRLWYVWAVARFGDSKHANLLLSVVLYRCNTKPEKVQGHSVTEGLSAAQRLFSSDRRDTRLDEGSSFQRTPALSLNQNTQAITVCKMQLRCRF